MSVRLFNWRDLLTLHRYRQRSVFLDSELLLTRGPLLVPGALLSYVAPEMGVITCVGNSDTEKGQSVFGQFIHTLGSPFAHLTFLTPEEHLQTSPVSALLDYLVAISGERGALRLLADVDERSEAFEVLRRDGFSTFSRQRIWCLDSIPTQDQEQDIWRNARSGDLQAIHNLCSNLVPALVQQVEPCNWERPRGMVYYVAEELMAFIDLRSGHRGFWMQPYIHPDVDNLADLIVGLLNEVPYRSSRPLYICVRSYQAWLEPMLEELGASTAPSQALMVRHLAVSQKAENAFALRALEGGSPEVSAPIVRSENNNSWKVHS